MSNICFTSVLMEGISKKDIFDTSGNFDFNKLIPMPRKFELMPDEQCDLAVFYYLTEKDTVEVETLSDTKRELLENVCDLYPLSEATINTFRKWIRETGPDGLDALYAAGRICVNNYMEYGAANWWEWRRQNWKTKTNALDTNIVSDDEMEFTNAWITPVPVLAKLSEKYQLPVYAYWQEDYGAGGAILFENGKAVDGCSFQVKCLPEGWILDEADDAEIERIKKKYERRKNV